MFRTDGRFTEETANAQQITFSDQGIRYLSMTIFGKHHTDY